MILARHSNSPILEKFISKESQEDFNDNNYKFHISRNMGSILSSSNPPASNEQKGEHSSTDKEVKERSLVARKDQTNYTIRTYCEGCSNYLEPRIESRVNTTIKLIFNFIMTVILLGIFAIFCYIIYDDVNNKIEHAMQHEASRISQCEKEYRDNQCEPHLRIPAAEKFCQEKDLCRFQNPRSIVMTSKTVSVLAAEVINGLLSTLEVKAIVVLFTFLFGIICVCNCSLSQWGRRESTKPYTISQPVYQTSLTKKGKKKQQ